MQMEIQPVIVAILTFGIHQLQYVKNHRYQIVPATANVIRLHRVNQMLWEF